MIIPHSTPDEESEESGGMRLYFHVLPLLDAFDDSIFAPLGDVTFGGFEQDA